MPTEFSDIDSLKPRSFDKSYQSSSTGIPGVDEVLADNVSRSRRAVEDSDNTGRVVKATADKVQERDKAASREVENVPVGKRPAGKSGGNSGSDSGVKLEEVLSRLESGGVSGSDVMENVQVQQQRQSMMQAQQQAQQLAAQQQAAAQHAAQQAAQKVQQDSFLRNAQMMQAQQPSLIPQSGEPLRETKSGSSSGNVELTKDELKKIIDEATTPEEDPSENKTSHSEDGRRWGEVSNKNAIPLADVDVRKIDSGPLNQQELSYHIDKAMDANGITDPHARSKWKNVLIQRIQQESGFNPNAVNDSDSNAVGEIIGDGHRAGCSRGLGQAIPSTFAANHVAGTSKNIYDPTANIAAIMRYIMNRYGVGLDASGLDGWHAAYAGRGY